MGHSLWGRKESDTTEPLTLSGLAALTAVWVRGSQGSRGCVASCVQRNGSGSGVSCVTSD